MLQVDWLSAGIGAGVIVLFVIAYSFYKLIKKPKINLLTLKIMVKESHNQLQEVNKTLMKLWSMFQEMENSSR